MGLMELSHFLLEDEVALCGAVLVSGAIVGFAARMVRQFRQKGAQ